MNFDNFLEAEAEHRTPLKGTPPLVLSTLHVPHTLAHPTFANRSPSQLIKSPYVRHHKIGRRRRRDRQTDRQWTLFTTEYDMKAAVRLCLLLLLKTLQPYSGYGCWFYDSQTINVTYPSRDVKLSTMHDLLLQRFDDSAAGIQTINVLISIE